MDDHLGYEKNNIEGNNSGNSRNGYSKKNIQTRFGETELNVPRDRNGSFEPKIIKNTNVLPTKLKIKLLPCMLRVCLLVI